MPIIRLIRRHAAPLAIAGTLLGASAALIVQPHANAATPVQQASATASHETILQHVDKRLARLKQRLAITPDEEPAWDAFAQVSEKNATAMAALYQKRAADLATMNAVQNMESYAAIQARQADNMNKLSAAFQTLYGKLTPTQQHEVDAMFRAEAEHHLGHRHTVKHG